MGDPDEQKAFVGRIALYNELSKAKNRSFLGRNLKTILDAHEGKKVKKEEGEGEWGLFEKMAGERIWEAAFWAQKPVLSITGLSLRRRGEKRRARAEDEDGGPAWLPRSDETRLACQITVAVREPRPDRKPYYLDSRHATIISRGRDSSKNATFEVRLHQPFEIEIGKLLAVKSERAEDHWQRGLAEEYHLEVGIHCHDSDDTAEFLSQIHGGESKQYMKVPGNEGIIRASWEKLPDLPKAKTLLPLKRGRGSKGVELPFGAEICMSWNEQVSPLVICNRALRLERGERLQLPTPASDDLESTSDKVLVKYLFRQAFQTRTLVTRELKCILCERKPEHSSFERLHLHYTTYHDHLQFEASNESNNCKVFRIQIPEERPSAREHKLEKNESWEWQAPEQAFDIAAHLEGDTMWTNANARPKGATRPTPKKDKTKRAVSPEGSPLRVPVRARKELLTPADVPNLRNQPARKHTVPRVPNINFYRTTSKQQVEQGTEISDSDEEADESWLQQSQRQHLLDMELDVFAVDFHELFNRHLSEERPMSDRLTRDAVIRFARKFKVKLGEPVWSERLRAKLEQLETGKVVGRDVVEYCMGMVARPRTPERGGGTPEPKTGGSDLFPDSPGTLKEPKEKEKTQSPQKVNFGRRNFICVRPEPTTTTTDLFPIDDLVLDDGIDPDAIEPSDCCWEIFNRILEFRLKYKPDTDRIWCSTNKTDCLVTETSWQKTLTTARDTTKGPIRFELISQATVNERTGEVAERKKENKRDMCVCGEKVTTMRKTIACAEPRCTRAFHMVCVGLERRNFEWRCGDCG